MRAELGKRVAAGDAPDRRWRSSEDRRVISSPLPLRSACRGRARRAHRGSPPRSCPGPRARAAAISPATPNAISAAAVAATHRSRPQAQAADQRRGRAAHRGDARHQRMAVGDRGEPRAVGDEVVLAGQRRPRCARAERIARQRRVVGFAAPASARELGAVEPQRARLLRRPASCAKAARGGERSMNTGSSTQGMRRLSATATAASGRLAPLGVERAEIDQQRVGARDERADLLRRDASSTAPRRPPAACWR